MSIGKRFFSMLAALMILLVSLVSPVARAQSSMAQPAIEARLNLPQVVDKLVTKNLERADALQKYQGRRTYTLTYSGFPAALHAELDALARQEGVTLFMALFTAFLTLLHYETGQDDMVVGMPVSGRMGAETADLIGLFINTLAVRTDLAGGPSFRELLQRVRITALDAYIPPPALKRRTE